MDGKKIFIGFIGFVAACLLIGAILLTSIKWVAFDLNYYGREYKRLHIPKATGIKQGDLLVVTQELLNYLEDKRSDLDILLPVHGQERLVFNSREIQHMIDVKELFTLGYKLRRIFLGTSVAMTLALFILRGRRSPRDFGISYLGALGTLAVFSLVLLYLIYLDFTAVWDGFHHIFFTNDLWLLDPSKDIMIQMFPEEFFLGMVMRILKIFASSLLALASIFGIVIYRTGKYAKGP